MLGISQISRTYIFYFLKVYVSWKDATRIYRTVKIIILISQNKGIATLSGGGKIRKGNEKTFGLK